MEIKKKIFIIDDDIFLLDMYALKFNQSNFEVETALGPIKALEKFHSGFVPDVILLDIIMPEMDGFELLEKMQEEKLAPTSIRVILSNRGQQSDIARGEALGAQGYIVKANSTPSEVVMKVTEIINKVNLTV
ncbi:MAG: two-component system, OmpR family, response regulator [Patescibacteria group bacterium]|nr:two-component system, OmpR family, response regulator [Patescibacteria group bacterium]